MLLLSSTLIKAQIPFNDPSSWNLQSAANGTEEFNAPLDFITNWHNRYNFNWNGTYSYGAAEICYPDSLIETGTTLKIKLDTLAQGIKVVDIGNYGGDSVTYVYQGGVLWRKQLLYKYGYLEISAKFPTGCYSLWTTFWLWFEDCYASPPYYNEIDIIENAAEIVYDGYKVTSNTWIWTPEISDTCAYQNCVTNYEALNTAFLLSADFHKYAIEWAPDRIIWYIDDIVVRTIYDTSGLKIPQNAMTAILSAGINPSKAFLPADWTFSHTPTAPVCFDGFGHPKYFEIDYLRYYKLNVDCSDDLTNLCVPTSYSRAVKKSITTNPSCTPTFNPTTLAGSYTLRAVDHVTLNEGVVINPTSVGYFAIQTMECPQ